MLSSGVNLICAVRVVQGLQAAKRILRGLEDSKLAGRSYTTSAIGADALHPMSVARVPTRCLHQPKSHSVTKTN